MKLRAIAPLLFFLLIPFQLQALEVGALAPDFTLQTYDGKSVSLKDFRGKTVVLEWFNKGCPFVQKHYRTGAMQALQAAYADKEIVWLTINSTHPGHENYLSREEAETTAKEWHMRDVTMLVDGDGKVGRQYEAKTTPHMYVINRDGVLVYRGAIDDDPGVFSDPKAAKNYVRQVLGEVLSGKAVSIGETKPYGCSVKYKS